MVAAVTGYFQEQCDKLSDSVPDGRLCNWTIYSTIPYHRPLLAVTPYTMSSKMPELYWKHERLAESFRACKPRMKVYLEDEEVENPAK